MKESRFINNNFKEWQEFETSVKQSSIEPEKLSFLFLKLTDDLSFARTHYPNRLVRQYLNQLGQTVFYKIYKNKKVDFEQIRKFWSHDLSSHIWHSRKELIFTFLFFLFSVIIGVVSSVYEPEFVRVILGDDYVNMTLENIDNGDPMAVYKKSNEVDMFLGITFNNITVSIYTFLSGAFAVIGSLYFMFVNGIMLGSFQYFFVEKGLFLESFLTIWQHGTLEISSIIIAGASGVVMGKGILFPGTYSRGQSFRVSAKRGLNLLMGIIPILVVAGFIEGFFTRYTDAPDILRVISILASLSFIVYLFIYRPWSLYKQGKINEQEFEENLSNSDTEIELFQIKDFFEVFNDSIVFIKNKFRSLFGETLLLAILYSAIAGLYYYVRSDMWDYQNSAANQVLYYLNFEGVNLLAYTIHIIFITIIIYRILLKINKKFNRENINKISVRRVIHSAFISLTIIGLMTLQNGWSIVVAIFVLPWPIYFFMVGFWEDLTFEGAYLRVSDTLESNHMNLFGINIIVLFVLMLLTVFFESPFANFGSGIFSMSMFSSDELSVTIGAVIVNTIGWMIVFTAVILLFTSLFIAHYSFIEKNEALTLNKEIDALFVD
ncbi:MAG: stage II sporulation protein M [Bacteroidota bacterium]